MNLSAPKKDLDIARKAIDNMKSTQDFSEFQESWENFLFRIERAWEFTERTLKSRKGFQQWHKPYTDLRKKDSLLVFLKQARNAEMHSVSPTVTNPLKMTIVESNGRKFQINSISSKLEDGTLTIDLDSPDILLDLDTRIIPTAPEVMRFKNRGKWFNPPWQHLKKRIRDLHPVALAELGLTFYNTYVHEAELWCQKT
ncbi:hypothetical protein [Hydrogenovibrio thermophilus]|jgi:hypothetical protein|uniref:Uncharacterized protein n=1 Tax=Hydrogenovibrio thermophilus TaxID=265883 RepID=A0A410H443_9GAMM|nr:hypothetical protein [Hydrogenovibrio thermophilus]QAB15671.1 hypothetical protein EPV75_08315 [Hydrogenovibrio thermophilus]